ncbi:MULTISPECIES: FecR domain-containing protein [Oxalobacteraceae]|uniref:FecR domain-containing protein n=1 Tax=Herminiimonas sp. Marseille-P9896 TaxID=2742211 RepID=UPI0020CA4015|nr:MULTISPECIES: FecR family protein [Oxalobacteraceae]
MSTLDIKLRSSGLPSRAPSAQVLQQAAEWFVLLRSGTASDEDRSNWRNWLQEDSSHQDAWGYVENISRRFEPVQSDNRKDAAVAAFHNARNKLVKRRQILNGIALLAGGGLLGWVASRHQLVPDAVLAWNADYRTATGEVREIAMQDGTHIWLNTASAFNADYQTTLRRVHLLEGEMLIQTAADKTRPFVVDTKQGRMRALGTRFTVRQNDDITQLTVFEGAVEVSPAGTDATRIIEAGQQISFSNTAISESTPAEAAREAWIKQILLAEDMSLQDLVAELNRYHHGYLHVAPEVANLRVLGGYPLQDKDKVLSMLEEVLPIHIRRTMPWWITIEAKKASG